MNIKDLNEITEDIKNSLTETTDRESVIDFLRLNSYSKLESIEIFRKALNISFYEAQDIIQYSQTWSDVKEFDEKLMNLFFDMLEETAIAEIAETQKN